MTTEPPALPGRSEAVRAWINEHPWHVAGGVLAAAAIVWAALRPAPPAAPLAIKAVTATSTSARTESTAKVILATANLLITADGCQEATVEFDASGAPVRIHSRGGRLTVQAAVSTTRHESTSVYVAATSTSTFTDTTFARRTWRWSVGAGAAIPRPAIRIDLDRHVGELFGLDVGLGLGTEIPFGTYVPNRLAAQARITW